MGYIVGRVTQRHVTTQIIQWSLFLLSQTSEDDTGNTYNLYIQDDTVNTQYTRNNTEPVGHTRDE